jgi:hypothetical protein
VDVQVRVAPVASEMTSISAGPFWSPPDVRLVAMASLVPSAVRAIDAYLEEPDTTRETGVGTTIVRRH